LKILAEIGSTHRDVFFGNSSGKPGGSSSSTVTSHSAGDKRDKYPSYILSYITSVLSRKKSIDSHELLSIKYHNLATCSPERVSKVYINLNLLSLLVIVI